MWSTAYDIVRFEIITILNKLFIFVKPVTVRPVWKFRT